MAVNEIFSKTVARLVEGSKGGKEEEAEAERVVAKLGQVSTSNRSLCCL